jgi:hypothetical protein
VEASFSLTIRLELAGRERDPSAISLSLSLAASDVALMRRVEIHGRNCGRWRAKQSVSIDGETLSRSTDEVLIKDGAAYLHLSFAIEGRPKGPHYGSPIRTSRSRANLDACYWL